LQWYSPTLTETRQAKAMFALCAPVVMYISKKEVGKGAQKALPVED